MLVFFIFFIFLFFGCFIFFVLGFLEGRHGLKYCYLNGMFLGGFAQLPKKVDQKVDQNLRTKKKPKKKLI